MHQIRTITKAKITLLRNALAAVEIRVKLLVLTLWILALGGLSLPFVRFVADLSKRQDRGLIILSLWAVAFLVALLWNMPFAIKRLFKAEENKLLRVLPISSSELFWIRAVENIFWNIVVLFPIGCSFIVSCTIRSANVALLTIGVPLWFLATALIGILQTTLAKQLTPLIEYFSSRVPGGMKSTRKSGHCPTRRVALPNSRTGAIIGKNLLVYFREQWLSARFITGLTIVLSLAMSIIAINRASQGEWETLRIMLVVVGLWITALWAGIVFRFSEKEVMWLLKALPLSSKDLYYAEFCGLFLFLSIVGFLFLLPSTIAVLVKGGSIWGINGFALLYSFVCSLWAMGIKFRTCPKRELGAYLFCITIFPALIPIVIIPALTLGVIGLSCWFARTGIKRLETYEFT